jgi:hypothetical protein
VAVIRENNKVKLFPNWTNVNKYVFNYNTVDPAVKSFILGQKENKHFS